MFVFLVIESRNYSAYVENKLNSNWWNFIRKGAVPRVSFIEISRRFFLKQNQIFGIVREHFLNKTGRHVLDKNALEISRP